MNDVWKTLVLTSVISMTIFSTNAFAMECVGLSTAEGNFEIADLVFTGRVVEVSNDEPAKVSPGPPTYNTFEVIDVFKGSTEKEVTIESYPNDGATCGFNFYEGEEYLVFASTTNSGFYTDLNSGTKSLDAAQEDMRFLDPLPAFINDVQNIHPAWILPFLIIASIPLGIGFGIFFAVRKILRKKS